MSDTHKAYTAALINATIVGFSFMFITIALETVGPLDLLMYRFFFAVLGASVPLIMGKAKLNIAISDFSRIIPLALFYPVMFFTFEAFGVERSASSEAGIILATVPIFTTILSRLFLKERTTLIQNLFILLSIIGVVYIFMMNSVGSVTFDIGGTFFLLLSTLAISTYNVMARKLSQEYSYFSLVYIMLWIGFLSFLLLSISSKLIAGQPLSLFYPLLHFPFLSSVLYLGVLSAFLTAMLTNYALSKLEASRMSMFGHLSTVISILAGVFILNEPLKYYHLIGITFIIIGVIGTNYFKQSKQVLKNAQTLGKEYGVRTKEEYKEQNRVH